MRKTILTLSLLFMVGAFTYVSANELSTVTSSEINFSGGDKKKKDKKEDKSSSEEQNNAQGQAEKKTCGQKKVCCSAPKQ